MGAADGQQAIALCRENDYELIVLDVMLPDMDGFTTCQAIRRMKDIPVLMLSALGTEYDKLLGFEMGVDDYMVKPFSPKELMARVNVIVSRHQKQAPQLAEIGCPGLRMDTAGRNVYVDEQKVELTAKEYELLLYFMENQNRALSRSQILNAVWGYDYFGDERTVDWQIKLLRGKLGKHRGYIVTMRGVGYKFETER